MWATIGLLALVWLAIVCYAAAMLFPDDESTIDRP